MSDNEPTSPDTRKQKFLENLVKLIPAEIIAFGYPEAEMKVVQKKSLDQVVFYNDEFGK